MRRAEMHLLIHSPFNRNSTFFNPSLSFINTRVAAGILPLAETLKPYQNYCKSLLYLSLELPKFSRSRVTLCSKNEVFEESTDTILTRRPEELELLDKPYPKPGSSVSVEAEPSEVKKKQEILEPFLKFFRPLEEKTESTLEHFRPLEEKTESTLEQETEKASVEYYEPKPGDFVVGVVVSGNENRLDVNVGADMLGIMLTKDVLPLYDKEMDDLLCDLEKDAEGILVRGKVGIVKSDEAISGQPPPGKPVVELGTILFAEVLGRTLGGRPLLSTRKLFKRMAWHRVRQIKQLSEPIEIKITKWNTGGLLTRIEGLRAFIPKAELINRVNNFTELKENVSRRIHVRITRINEDTNDLILSEKDAWEMLHLQEGTLLSGTVKKIFPYGAQIRIGDSNRSGLLHISNITRVIVTSISDVLAVDEEVKVLVLKPKFQGKISLSIAELESEPGLFLRNKAKVLAEAEEMAKKYRQKLPSFSPATKLEIVPANSLPFEDEEKLYANWGWFKFERNCNTNP